MIEIDLPLIQRNELEKLYSNSIIAYETTLNSLTEKVFEPIPLAECTVKIFIIRYLHI